MSDYKCYMRRVDILGEPEKDLEVGFPGLIYKEFSGLDSYGKINLYIPKNLQRQMNFKYIRTLLLLEKILI